MTFNPVFTAAITGLRERDDRLYPLRAIGSASMAAVCLSESQSVINGLGDKIQTIHEGLYPQPEIGPFDENEYAADLQCDPTIDEAEFNDRIDEYRAHIAARFETDTSRAAAEREAAQPAVLGLVAQFATHAAAADLDSNTYTQLNHLLAEVGLTRITELDDRERRRITSAIAARW